MKAVLILLSLAVATPAMAAKPKTPATPEARADQQEIAKLKRELASAMLVKRLDFSREQRRELLALVREAKALRAAVASDKEVDAVREKKKEILRKAIADARATGKVSPQTRVELESLKDDAKALRGKDPAKAKEIKELRERFRRILTEQQKEELQRIAADLPGKRGGKFAGERGEKARKGVMLRLLLSDELEAELAR